MVNRYSSTCSHCGIISAVGIHTACSRCSQSFPRAGISWAVSRFKSDLCQPLLFELCRLAPPMHTTRITGEEVRNCVFEPCPHCRHVRHYRRTLASCCLRQGEGRSPLNPAKPILRDVAQCGVLFVFGRCLDGGVFSFRGKNSGQEFVCRIVVQARCPHQLGVASRALQYPQSEPPPFAYTHEPHCPSAHVASRKIHNRHFAGRPIGSVRCCKVGALARPNMRARPYVPLFTERHDVTHFRRAVSVRLALSQQLW
jgi:hypothetical protein